MHIYSYSLYMKKDGKNVVATERRSPFPPDDARGKEAIANLHKLAQVAGLKGPCAVAMLNGDGTKTWFNRYGQSVFEGNAFGEAGRS